MPRRSPGEIRARLPHRIDHGTRAVIRGLSNSANRQIASFERHNGLHRGVVADAVSGWGQPPGQHRTRYTLSDPYYGDDHGDWRQDDYHPRTLIEHALAAMRERARRELRGVVVPRDERVLARTLNNPFAPGDLPWWKGRLDI
uniref:Uncharacterized protein n=1 Tax=Streptomyces sp. NBC_00049 TaxID=2903617 RepID=A0AAU2JIB7_9ACTN